MAALLVLAATAARAETHPRVVSINLCSDQLLLALGDPDQILGLSPFARDAVRSFEAAKAARFPALSGTAEEVLGLRPDLVLGGRFGKRATREMLKGQGIRLVELDAVRSLAESKRQIVEVGALLGHPDRAEAAVAAIDAAAARARQAASGKRLTVLPLQRRGWVSGRDTLMTSLLDTVGLANAGAALSPRYGQFVTLESVVALHPDLLLLSNANGKAEDQGSAMLQHPALRDLYPPQRRLVLSEKLTVCGGPMLADALDSLAAQIKALP